MKKFHIYLIISALILFIIPFSIAHVNAESNIITISKHHQQNLSNTTKENLTLNKQQLTKEQIVSITQQFMDHLVQETDQNYRVNNYQTLEAYKNSFKDMASKEVVDMFVDFYYKEKGQALYIKPTETPPWFVSDNDYELTPLENNTYRVKQSNNLDLYGSYTVIFDIKLNENGEPYIMNVQYQ